MSDRSGAAHAAAGSSTPTKNPDVVIRPVRGKRELAQFMKLPWSVYQDDPVWVPPLLHDVKQLLDRDKHPFHRHADVELFLAWRDRRPVGRVAAIVNRSHNEFHEDRVGFFGLFECEDDEAVARALLQAAEVWLRDRDMDRARGPMNLSTNDELYSPGVVVDGFDQPHRVMLAHTPRYYARLLEASGFQKANDLIAYELPGEPLPPRLVAMSERITQRTGVTIRPLDMRRYNEEVALVQSIYVSAWERNWGFTPITPDEIQHLARSLKPALLPRLCGIAEVDGEPVGFGLALPDYNQVLRRVNGRLLPFGFLKLLWYKRTIDVGRVLTLGLKPDWRNTGIHAVLMLYLLREGVNAGLQTGDCSWILEDNTMMRRVLERAGASAYKTFRVYEKALDGR
jgi:GNAT superfamily N-acetyltransferase